MRYLKWLAKFFVTVALLWWVFRRIDLESVSQAIGKADKLLLALAFVPYIASRLAGAVRLTTVLQAHEIGLSHYGGLHLNWISMFYGMFLPGGLGGDAYKLLRLKQHFPAHGTMLLTRILLWDRIIGFVMLALLAGVIAMFRFDDFLLIGLIIALALPGGWALWWSAKKWLPGILPVIGRVLLLSFGVQAFQIICTGFLLYSMGEYGHFKDYALLFLISSIATVFPLSIGGIGVRELVYLRGSVFLGVLEPVAVTVSFLFDIIVTATAITGAVLVIGQRSDALPGISSGERDAEVVLE
ncbi:flippase-like domain-containing protein [Dyadobacter sp. CY261]|uniref:lysylphosphatidylglycerol synthase transmembrane domain-containing protein n=1 Tax=Dyadobacter sp. CY261 TaxID=2907203 RepID=UPI001F4861AE|nr:lysylphosphatidylglycerol synthase transmembrane domain-containing protein [Dyadobacter sp. CY261]MCF0069822.1 flippase-like domain-containing protein [Dyadobacter sp. CY261]